MGERFATPLPVLRRHEVLLTGCGRWRCRSTGHVPFQSEEITELGELTRSEIEPGAMLTVRAARLIVSDEPAAVVMLDE